MPRFVQLLVLVVALAVGCGDGKTYRITGKVTFKGQPVAAGKVYFSPDGSKGNTRPSGFAEVRNGEYDTDAAGGRGYGGGPTVIAVEGFDPKLKGKKDDPSGESTAGALFPRYEFSVDLPREPQTKDIVVPDEPETR
jgi:hypothetical protein